MDKVLYENLSAYVKQVQPVASQHVVSKETLLDFSTENANVLFGGNPVYNTGWLIVSKRRAL